MTAVKTPSKEPKWKSLSPPYEVGKDDFADWNMISDCEGWVDATAMRPLRYALCHLRTEEFTCKGWWDGFRWDGLRIKEEHKILHWKKAFEGPHAAD